MAPYAKWFGLMYCVDPTSPIKLLYPTYAQISWSCAFAVWAKVKATNIMTNLLIGIKSLQI